MTIEPVVFKTLTKEAVFKTVSKQIIVSNTNNIYWVSHNDSVFSSNVNWSLIPGGPSCGFIPGPENSVYFDFNGLGSCLFDIPVQIFRLNLLSGYPGFVKQKDFPFTSGDVNINGGTFLCGSAPVQINGSLTVS